jgi:hypothetical protein
VLVQAIGLRLLGSLAEAREVVRRSFEVTTYTPRERAAWEGPYRSFQKLINGPSEPEA